MFFKKKKKISGPRIWIYADMEGINNITSWDEVNPAKDQYKKGVRLMTKELNSSIRGAFRGGAEEVFVNDLHWFYSNVNWKKVDKKVTVCDGKNLNIREFFEKDFDAVFIVGMHAKANVKNAILPHSWYLPSYIRSMKFSGKAIGEVGLIKLLAEEKGVPVIFISGDRAGCEEAKKICPNILIAETKKKVGDKIELMSEKNANKLVYKKSKETVENFKNDKKNYAKKISSKFLESTFGSEDLAKVIKNRCKNRGVKCKKVDKKTLRFFGKSFSETLDGFFGVLD